MKALTVVSTIILSMLALFFVGAILFAARTSEGPFSLPFVLFMLALIPFALVQFILLLRLGFQLALSFRNHRRQPRGSPKP